jgi:hypothetical protein
MVSAGSEREVSTLNESPEAAAKARPADGRIRSLAVIVILDIAAPLAAYQILTSQHHSAVTALLVSGVFPAVAVIAGVVRNHRVDVIGGLVLAGVVIGVVTGLTFHSARLLLVEGSVPTGVLGLACLGSLRRRPLMFTFFLEFVGPETRKGRELAMFWGHPAFRRGMRVITAVWGIGFLAEAVALPVVIYTTSTGTALAFSKVMPYVVTGILTAWTIAYGDFQRRRTVPASAAAPAGGVPANSPEAAR